MLRLVEPLPEPVDVAITVAQAARVIGCDGSTVRALLAARQLKGNRVGKGDKPRGVRVSLESAERYKARNSIGGEDGRRATPPRPTGNTAAHRLALEELKRMGIVR